MASDARLLRASINGDHDAFAHIVHRYQSLVCAVTYSGTGDLAVSEDLAQETFLRAWQRLASLRDPAGLRTWLCAIARNLTTDHLRCRQRDVVADATHLEDASAVATALPTPAEQAAASEHEQLVWAAVREIPEDYRIPLILYYREQHSVGRVAQAMELSRSAVKHRLVRARGMVKDRLASLVDDTLTKSAPGGAFGAAVLAGIGRTAASKAAGSGTTILGLSLAKAAAVGVLAAGAAVGGGLAVQHLAGGGPAPVVPAAAEAPEPADKAPQQGAVYAERIPKQIAMIVEARIPPFLAIMSRFPGGLETSAAGQVDALVGELCMTRDPTSIDLTAPVWGVSLNPEGTNPNLAVCRLTDAERYLASLLPDVARNGEEGGVRVYVRTTTKQTLLVDPVARWGVVGTDAEEARTLMQMLQAGDFPSGGFFPDVPYGGMQRVSALLGNLRQAAGIPAAPGGAPPKSWAALADTTMRWASAQVGTLAFAASMTEGEYSLKLQLQPVAGAALAERLAAAKPADPGLLKYMPADSLAVLHLRLPNMEGLLPKEDDAPVLVRVLRRLGDEAALSLGRSAKGSVQFVLAARMKSPASYDAAALAIDVAALARGGQTDPASLRLGSTESPHFVVTAPYRPFAPPGTQAATLRRVFGEDLKLYEFTVDDTLILAFGDGIFEKVGQVLDGGLPDIGHAPRFTEAMADLPSRPLAAGLLEAEGLASWVAAMVPGARPLTFENIVKSPPIALAAHVVGRDVLEVDLRLPQPALAAFLLIRKGAVPPPPPAAAPPLPAAAPPPLPTTLQEEVRSDIHAAASAGDVAKVQRLLEGGATVNALGPENRTPLHLAAEQGQPEVVQLLLARGADVNAGDDQRRTPLHLAAQGAHRAVVEALLEAGADVNATDLDGRTPTGLAVQAGHDDVADLLRERGGVE